MNQELQNLLCNCGSDGYIGTNYRPVSPKDDCSDDFNDNEIDCPKYESDRDEKLLNDWKVLDDDSWDVISTLRQKFCQLSKSEAEAATLKESPHSSYTYTNRQPFECHSIVERASNLIDYTPESEFLRKIKQQCQYLQNRLPNIFSALNECFPECEIYECQKCLVSKSRAQQSNIKLKKTEEPSKCCSQQNFSNERSYENKKMRMKHSSIFQRTTLEREKSCPVERVNVTERKSEHISRSKKPVKHKKIRKRKSNDSGKCESENEFEPSLKKPNENSCERCWRFASPARSPVNKPDQRYDPNFRRGHSTTNFEKGDGDPENCVNELESPNENNQPRAPPNMGREFPSARHTCEGTPNRLPENASPAHVPPHICIKQKIEAAAHLGHGPPTAQNLCPRHRSFTERPASPSPKQNLCPKHRASLQQSALPSPTQHICPKHMGSLQQHEHINLSPNNGHRCMIHQSESPQQRSPQQRSPQQRSPQQSTPQYSPSAFTKVKDLMYSPYEIRHTCKQPCEHSLNEILCNANLGKRTSPRPCPTGPPGGRRLSPSGIDDLDVTEYKEICTTSRKQSPARSPDPCGRAESAKKSPTCGGCPTKSARPCDHPKLECIPEGQPAKEKKSCKQGEDGDGNGRGNGSGNGSGNGKGGGKGNNGFGNEKSGSLGSKDNSSRQAERTTRGSKSESTKSTGLSKKGKQEKSPTGGGSKGASKKGKSDAKSKRGEKSPKKTPDKSKALSGKGVGGRSCLKKTGQFDKAHPVRPCKCPPRVPETEGSSGAQTGSVLCCHCDWEGNNCQYNGSRTGKSGNGNHNCRCSTSPKTAAPECKSPTFKENTMECPYRAYANKFGLGTPKNVDQGHCPSWEDSRRRLNEPPSPSTQELLDFSPRKYFVFYMSKAKEKNENDVEVLVEELAQGCPKDGTASRTKEIAEKMKKISEHPPDSMALRFQKGVSEAGNIPKSSRILYF